MPVIKMALDIRIPVASLLSMALDFQREVCPPMPHQEQPFDPPHLQASTGKGAASLPCPTSPWPGSSGHGKGDMPVPFTRLQASETWEVLPEVSAAAPSSPPAPMFGRSRAQGVTQAWRLAEGEDAPGRHAAIGMQQPPLSSRAWAPSSFHSPAIADGAQGSRYPPAMPCPGQALGSEVPVPRGLRDVPPSHDPPADDGHSLQGPGQRGPTTMPPTFPLGAGGGHSRGSF